MGARKTALAVFQALVLLVSVVGVGVAITPDVGGHDTGVETSSGVSVPADRPGASIQVSQSDQNSSSQTVVLRLVEADIPATASPEEAERILKNHAEETQANVENFATSNSGVTIRKQFWLTNAVVVEVGPNVDLDRLAKIEGVTEIHDNFEVTVPQSTSSPAGSVYAQSSGSSAYNTTYGLAQINATEVWTKYQTMGQGATVAVLDTGVDGDHPAINDSLEKFAEFDSAGNKNSSPVEVRDTSGHGTHTSGTIVGDNASGQWIGVAPKADLYHGLVLPGGSGTFAQVVGGMQWAVENDADVISMSLGSTGYFEQFIDPVQNSEAAGTLVVASIGNSGEGSSGSPGNVYETLSVGASNANRNIADFSSGENISTSTAWSDADSEDIEDWPAYYTVPDVAAPGVRVLSSIPDDDYSELSGTSMAAPHVAGVAALAVSAANNNPSVDLLKEAIKNTAIAPSGANETRYGQGIVNATGAVEYVRTDQTASARLAEDIPDHTEPGTPVTARFRVSNVDRVNVTLTGGMVDPSNVSVTVNGTPASAGLPASVDVPDGTSTDVFTVTINVTEEKTTGVFNVSFLNTASGTNDTETLNALKVHPDPLIVNNTANESQVNANLSFAAAGTTVAFEAGTYTFDNTVEVTDISVRPAGSGDVTFDTNASTAVWLYDGGAPPATHFTGIDIDGNESIPNARGMIITGAAVVNRVNVENVSWGIDVLNTQNVEIKHSSISTTASGSPVNASGVYIFNSSYVEIHNVSIDVHDRTAQGVYGEDSYSIRVSESEIRMSAPKGVSADADAVELLYTSDTLVANSVITTDAGSAIRTLGTFGTTVRSSELSGSKVSGGLTGTVSTVASGGSFSGTAQDALLNATASKSTRQIAGETVTVHNLQALSESEWLALRTLTTTNVSETLGPYLPDVSLAELRNMTPEERIEFANETLENVSRDDIEAIRNATEQVKNQKVGTTSHNSVELRDLNVTGELVTVLSFGSDITLDNVRVEQTSYLKTGVYAIDSDVYVFNSVIDPTTGDVVYETGILGVGSFVYVDESRVNATTGVLNYFGYSVADGSEFEGEYGMAGFGFSDSYQSTYNTTEVGIIDFFVYAVQNDFNSPVGIFDAEGFSAYNNFADTQVAVDGSYHFSRLDWFGDARGPSTFVEQTDGAEFDAYGSYDPFLTKPPANVTIGFESESQDGGTQAFATDLVMYPGEVYGFAVPGPVKGNVSQMFNDFNGVVYGFDAQTQSWHQVSGDAELDALDAVLVVPTTTARAVVDFEDSGDPTKVPRSKQLYEGWNFVGAPQYGDADDAFAASSADPARLINVYQGPYSQLGYSDEYWTVYTFGSSEYPPDVSAFKGYFVYAEQNGTLAANLPEGVTAQEMFQSLAPEELRQT